MKKYYRIFVGYLASIRLKFYILKTWIAEWRAILLKKQIYDNVVFSEEQQKIFESFWKNSYGKTISPRWHKLYQSINNTYDERYFPDIIFSTKLEPRLNSIEHARYVSDKGLTELIYSGVEGVIFPKTVLLNSSGYLYNENRNIINKKNAIHILQESGDLVIKPTSGGSSGHSVEIFTAKNTDIEKLLCDYKKDYIIQEKLIPHPDYNYIYPHSINTIRLISYVFDEDIYCAPLCLRVGSGGSNVDNIHSGGICVGVSNEGILNEYGYKLGYCNSKVKYKNHPDTDVAFQNYKVPGTLKMIEIANKLHGRTPHLGMVSWDFMLNNKGDVVLIEGNYYGQSIWFTQIVHGKPFFGEHTEYMLKLANSSM